MYNLRKIFFSALLALVMSSAMAETILVTNTNDTGPGSLRQAILDANASPGLTDIRFSIPGTADHVITVPQAGYPAFTQPVNVDLSSTQTGRVILNGAPVTGPGPGPGITFNAGSQGSSVLDLTFRNFVFSVAVNTSDVNIIFNRFEDNQGGIDIDLRSGLASNLLVRGNSFTSTHANAAIFGSGNTITIIGNSINGEYISLSNSSNVSIGGFGPPAPNTITNSPFEGILLTNVTNSAVLNNNISNSARAGINVSGSGNRIQSNRLSGNGQWDIIVTGNNNLVSDNRITGNNDLYNGINAGNGSNFTITGNYVDGGSIELSNATASTVGGTGTAANTVIHDPNGFSGHGAISFTNVSGSNIINNSIHDNASNGVYLSGSSNNLIFQNQIYNNNRTGIVVSNGNNNRISQNVIYNNHADVAGGRTGISLQNGNNNKAAPTITSARRVGNFFVISGTSQPNDLIQIFYSDRQSRNSSLVQNALKYDTSLVATGTTWSISVPAVPATGEVYFIATATDQAGNTSSFGNARGVEINGPTRAIINQASAYATEFIPGATYSWWTSLPVTSQSASGNTATFTFSQTGSGFVYVGVTESNGQYRQYQLAVTVGTTAKAGIVSTIAAETYPNPFASVTHVKISGTAGEPASIHVYNLNGELVYSSRGHQEGELVEVGNNLHPGIYSLQIIAGEDVKTTRIVKGL